MIDPIVLNENEQMIAGIVFQKHKQNGYYRTTINRKQRMLHRFVWEINIGEIPDGFVVHHIDGNKDNNILKNLLAIPENLHSAYEKKIFGEKQKERVCRYCGAKFFAKQVTQIYCSKQCGWAYNNRKKSEKKKGK